MGLIFVGLLLWAIVFAVNRFAAEDLKRAPQRFERSVDLSFMGRHHPALKTEAEKERERLYLRRRSDPRVHREALRSMIPALFLFLAVLVLVGIVAKSLLAVALMAVGVFFLGAGLCYCLNRQARAEHHSRQDQEKLVEEEASTLDDFAIPEEWTRKYL